MNDVPTAQLVETRKVLIAQINFNSTASILDTAQLQSQVFGTNNSVAQNVRESSYGTLDVDGEITPVLSIPATVPVVTCDRVAVMSYGQNTLVTAGYNLANYQHIVYVFPATGCNWLGLAEIGGSRSWILSNTGVPVGNVLAHELWHNLNLAHASSYANCVNGNISQSTCTYSEYGDQSDSVGYGFWNFLPINSTHRVQKLWLANPNVKDITKNGLYTVQTMSGISKSPDQPMVLRIKKMDTNEYYYVSYRRPTGLDANLPTGNTDGIYIHVGNDAIVNNSKLIISPTGSQVFNEGQTFTDSVNDVSITLDSRTNSSASVNIVTKRTVKDPVFNPTKTTFSKPFNVSISSSTNGATIYYTTDGSLPTTSSKIYTNPISVKKTTSIKAYASKTAMNDSNIVSITYIK